MTVPTFDPPGPGTWELDRSHYPSGITPIMDELARYGAVTAYRESFARVGVPADGIEFRSVNGFVYTRVRPLFGADSTSTRTPPDWIVKLLGRVHPEMRRREKLAATEIAGSGRFRRTLDDWNHSIKPAQLARNLEFQSIDLRALEDSALAQHIDTLTNYVRDSYVLHHLLHADDLGPLGKFVVYCRDRGIEIELAVQALIGATPSTSEPRHKLAALRAAIDAAGVAPATLDDVRDVSGDAAEQLDAYLARYGGVLYSGYDIDTPTLAESPDVLLTAIMSATEASVNDDRGTSVAATLRELVPEADRTEFDHVLSDARLAMDMRDDNRPLTVEWPSGLLRMTLLEAGRRLAESGRIADNEHIFELMSAEVGPLVRSGNGPSSGTLADRAAERAASRLLDPPHTLGPDPVEPPLHLLPPSMAKMLDLVLTLAQALFGANEPPDAPLSGTGIGNEVFVGTARVAETAEEAIATMEDGDVLVTRATSPAFNLVLAIAGGLVTVHGGPMSHAAVLSRELKLPAVIGVEDCLDHIHNGDRIELDPTKGTVTILD
ncbi:MAG: hypothetical protein GWP48_13405 [Actinobacteria bacterium]|nr:hypothetical protein [Actinomycetota bacterium]